MIEDENKPKVIDNNKLHDLQKADLFWKDAKLVETQHGTICNGAVGYSSFKYQLPKTEDADFEVIEPKEDYFMGVDCYDKENFAMCVMKRIGDDKNNTEVVAMYKGRVSNPKELESEITRIAEFYKIPENHILKEV